MKHKKFVKQLQALGLDRNGAEMCAAYSRRIREPYADGLARFRRYLQEVEAYIKTCPVEVTFSPQSVAVIKCEAAAAEEILHRNFPEVAV